MGLASGIGRRESDAMGAEMIVTPEPVELFLPPPRQVRSKGVHVSSIIRCIATEAGILKPEWVEELSLADVREITDPVAILRISIGLAWEEWYIPTILAIEGVIDHPGEMHIDGVYMTHDGESLDVLVTPHGSNKLYQHVVIHEVKATYKSTNTVGDLSKEWMWLAQMKAYCLAKRTRFCKMHTLFLCGDYSYPIKPQLKRWSIEFTQKEIDDNWDMLRQYKEERQ
jgi:hypothetical protein